MFPTRINIPKPVGVVSVFLFLVAMAPITSQADHHGLDDKTNAAIDAAIRGGHRSETNRARDQYRRPKETLEFFLNERLKSDELAASSKQSVQEIISIPAAGSKITKEVSKKV